MFRVRLVAERALVEGIPTWFYRAVVERYTTLSVYPYALWYLFDQSWLYETVTEAADAATELEALYVME